MHPKWIHKYELKPGRWVFEPSDDARIAGRAIKAAIKKWWFPPSHFYHLQAGGHVAALKAHADSTAFLHVDIQDFFSRINRSRVTRCLTPRFGYELARKYANDSTVRHPTEAGRYILPYGFIQSPILASLALHESALGARLRELSKKPGVVVSVYVDDIVVSCGDADQLGTHLLELKAAARRSLFDLNDEKEEGPAPSITAFNVEVWNGGMQIRSARMSELSQAFATALGDSNRSGIKGYVESVNSVQAATLI